MKHLPLTVLLFAVCGAQDGPKPEAMSLLGKPLHAAALPAETRVRLEANLATAKTEFDKDPGNADAAIWLGRRTAYLARFREAIAIYSAAITKHPGDARLYRHRGHRYITVREFDKAIDDLSKAASLVRDKPDEVEPDGQPNATQHPDQHAENEHLLPPRPRALLERGFRAALPRPTSCACSISKNADMQVATAHWQYMTLRRLSRARRQRRSARADHGRPWTSFENGVVPQAPADVQGRQRCRRAPRGRETAGLDAATIGYGVANWHLYNGRRAEALKLLGEIVEQNATQWAAFGYIAAEAELARAR